jgi:hypothetical protein
MTQEELKTCLGQLMSDLRGNWAFDYSERLQTAFQLCQEIEDDTSMIEQTIESQQEGDWDGRCFRGKIFYGYASEEGSTEEVKKWLENNLSYPEHCELLDK